MFTYQFHTGSHNSNGVLLLITIWWPQSLWKPSITSPCHTGIQKRRAHCKWPLIQDSFRCRQTFHALASRTAPIMKRPAHQRSSAHRRLFTVASRGGHLNHVTTIMTFLSCIKFRNLYCPRTIQFSQQQRALFRMLQTPLAVNDRDKKNIGICKCAALSCPLKLCYSGVLPHLATRVNAHAFGPFSSKCIGPASKP